MEILDYSKLLQDGLELPSAWGNANLKRHEMGELVTPTGKIVACDPFVFPDTSTFTVQLSPGRYPVVLSVARAPAGGPGFCDAPLHGMYVI